MGVLLISEPDMSPRNTAAPAQRTAEAPVFQCGVCNRSYTRVDHLARHVRSHTQSRPFKCQHCNRAFGRGDLLKRHMTCHDVPNGQAERMSNSASNVFRVSTACRACSSGHLRCTESKPCQRCLDRGTECVWSSPTDQPRPPLSPPESSSVNTLSQGLLYTDSSLSSPQLTIQYAPSTDALSMPSTGTRTNSDATETHQQGQTGGSNEHALTTTALSMYPDIDLLSGYWTPLGGLDFDMISTEFDDIDLHLPGPSNENIPFDFGSEGVMGRRTALDESSSDSPIAIVRSNAFRNSPWRFQPDAHDHYGAEEHNLSLPAATGDHPTPESQFVLEKRMIASKLGVVSRDRLLAIVVDNCRPQNLSKVVASFPSLELLDTLIQFYITSPITRSASFFHLASFDLSLKRAELLAAVAAAGAVLTLDSALTKLGYAIQECVRVAVPKLWERDNSRTRDLELSQAWMVLLETSLWSGQSRKVEIAESFLQPLLTMLRRNAKFRRSGYCEISVQSDDVGETLDQKWRLWIQQESFKRLAFRLLQHDTDSSLALMVNPLVSYAEVTLPLPCSSDLWAASSSEDWKSVYLSKSQSPAFVFDCLEDPEIITTGGMRVDTLATSLAYLSCAWRLAWEYIQLTSLRKGLPQKGNEFLMKCRQEELFKFLKQFRICIDPSMPFDIIMRLEAIHLHIFTPFEAIQVFAGMEGPEQVRATVPTVLQWAKSDGARMAVWHAGQIFRTAKSFPRGQIQGLAAIVLYHASLVLWVYGLHLKEDEPDSAIGPQSNPQTLNQTVWLDGLDDMALQRFIQFSRGCPSVRSVSIDPLRTESDNQSTIKLHQADKVLEAAIEMFSANHGRSRPSLVENLIQLLKVLQTSSAQKMARNQ
ncbi:fungal-specific transcription factor domain-containing protein [Xylaria digitata]|nr:fungal-specific transcription factor domain-containing protein [Xylaria digitata]